MVQQQQQQPSIYLVSCSTLAKAAFTRKALVGLYVLSAYAVSSVLGETIAPKPQPLASASSVHTVSRSTSTSSSSVPGLTTTTVHNTRPLQQAVPQPAQPIPSAQSASGYRYADAYLAICAVVKDQSKDLREFIDYHRWIGVRKFYIYDHNSSVPLVNVLEDYIRAGLVEYTLFAGHHYLGADKTFKQTAQGYAYRQCLGNGRRRHRWLAYIDTDEFIILKEQMQQGVQPDINSYMQRYEAYGGLGLNWRVFGTSGLKNRPSEGALASYWKCMPETSGNNQHIKSVVNVPYTATIGVTPHTFRYRNNMSAVNELFAPISTVPGEASFSKPASSSHIALYHYVTKSEEDFQHKLQRGGGAGAVKDMSFLTAVDAQSTDNCTDALQLWTKCCSGTQPLTLVDSNVKDNALDDDRRRSHHLRRA